jgi:beta propeller repeat protein
MGCLGQLKEKRIIIMKSNGTGSWSALITYVLFITLFLTTPMQAAPVGTETRISFSDYPYCNNVRPSADNGWIVWEESCPDSNDLLAYNYLTGLQLSLPGITPGSHAPNIRRNRVVWYETDASGLSSLYFTDLSAVNPADIRLDLPPSVKVNPVVDGDTIVWEDRETPWSFMSDILLYNISSSELYNLTPNTPGSSQVYPSIYGNSVVWLDDRNGQRDIFMNTTYSGWETVNVTPGITGSGASRPIINDDNIIWFDDAFTIYLDNLTTTTTLPTYASGDPVISVAVNSTYYAWGEDTGGGFGPVDIFIDNHLSPIGPEQITNSGSNLMGGVLSDPDNGPVVITPDSRIIWVDDRNGSPEIYMFTLGTAAECPPVRITTAPTEGPSPLQVQFNDISSPPFTSWRWDFGDGSTASTRNATHTYSTNGIYTARLVAGTPWCRNVSELQTISVGIPFVNFTGSPVEGLVPLTVNFQGTATGSPSAWHWDFGDGGSSPLQNPSHTYSTAGTYTVNLTAFNAYGENVRSRPGYIAARNGLEQYSFMNVTGLSVSGNGLLQSVTLTKTYLPAYSLSNDRKTLAVTPPAGYGWQTIVFTSADAAGFRENPANITGSISSTSLTILDLKPASFSPATGSNLRMNYNMELGHYSAPAYLLSRIWEGTLPSYNNPFFDLVQKSGFATYDVGYTLNVTRNNLSVPSRQTLHLSAGSSWLTGTNGIDWGRQHTYVIAMGYNETGALLGIVLPAHFTGNNSINQIEYFETSVPTDLPFLSTFALAQIAGSGNPLQLITLTVTSHVPEPEPEVNPPSDSDSGDTPVAGAGAGIPVATATIATTAPTSTPSPTATPVPTPTADPGVSAKIYANGGGVVTQATRLQSSDGKATLTVSEGVVAKDASGNPLSQMTIRALPPGSLPPLPSGSAFTFAGLAYEIGPDGATFSPPVTLSFTLPQAQWGQDYSVKLFDQASGTWQDLPTVFDPATGTVTAQVSNLCVLALFSEPRAVSVTTTSPVIATTVPVTATPEVTAQPPSTAVGIFSSMMAWAADFVVNNVIILVTIVIIIGIVLYLVQQGKFPGSGQ